jgi:FkbM family methyltransferase
MYEMIETKHGKFCIPTESKHRPASQAIIKGGLWEPRTIEYLQSRRCGDIIHAGAFFGDFFPSLASVGPRGHQIIAFEPNKTNYECALKTIEANGINNITLHNLALGEHTGTANLVVKAKSGLACGGASRIMQCDDPTMIEQVTTVRIDDVVPPECKISAIHLDVEGYELPILKGALNTINRFHPDLILEQDLEHNDWFLDNIFDLGYRYHERMEDNTLWVKRV